MPFQFDFELMLSRLLDAVDEDYLHEALAACAHDLGFQQFALGHHVDFVGPPRDAITLSNYDPGWIDHALGKGYHLDDPVHRASLHTSIGFCWSEISDFICLTDRQRTILETAKTFGLGEGYTVPVHMPGEYRGTCSFGARSDDRLRVNAKPIANILGRYAFEGARRIVRRRSNITHFLQGVPVLTGRQHDALVLVGRGKVDAEIGVLLGISRATAHEHVENVRRAYGNAQRALLIARALFDGQISFGEVFGR